MSHTVFNGIIQKRNHLEQNCLKQLTPRAHEVFDKNLFQIFILIPIRVVKLFIVISNKQRE
jgi:hypothetical protein